MSLSAPILTDEVLTDEAELAGLWPEWAALWRRAPGALPFLAPAWLEPWWKVFGTGRPVISLLRRQDTLIGLLPLYRLGDKLLPMGVGISDYFDLLLTPDAPPDAASALLSAALGTSPGLRCDLPELPEGAVLLAPGPPTGWRSEAWTGPPCPVLRLQPEPLVPKSMRRDLRQAQNRATRGGGWTVESADAASAPALLEALIRLHGARWAGRGETGVLADPAVLAFHGMAVPALLEAGLLRLQAVRLRGEIAAVIYALLGEGRIFFYLSGFHAGFGFESPGTILLGHMIEQATAEGRTEAHFLRGGESYKHAWGGLDRFNSGRSFVPE